LRRWESCILAWRSSCIEADRDIAGRLHRVRRGSPDLEVAHFAPVVGTDGSLSFAEMVVATCQCDPADIVAADIYLVPAARATAVGDGLVNR
jgi:hypothetical protein